MNSTNSIMDQQREFVYDRVGVLIEKYEGGACKGQSERLDKEIDNLYFKSVPNPCGIGHIWKKIDGHRKL